MTPTTIKNAEDLFTHAWMLTDIAKCLLNQKLYIDVWELDDCQFTVGQVKVLKEFTFDSNEAESAEGESTYYLFDADTPTDEMMGQLMKVGFEKVHRKMSHCAIAA